MVRKENGYVLWNENDVGPHIYFGRNRYAHMPVGKCYGKQHHEQVQQSAQYGKSYRSRSSQKDFKSGRTVSCAD